MKNYNAPEMNITMFSDFAETAARISGTEQQEYVEALNTIGNKAQINLETMRTVTRFTF